MRSELLEDLADRIAGRFYGKYRGIVSEVDAATMRIRATVPAVLDDLVSGWAMPCVPFAGPDAGFCFLPDVGSGVWIEFEGGDPSFPIWSGCFWFEGEVPSDVSEKVRGIVTAAPHRLLFDEDGGITVEESGGAKVELASGKVSAESGGGAKVELDGSSVKLNGGALEVT